MNTAEFYDIISQCLFDVILEPTTRYNLLIIIAILITL